MPDTGVKENATWPMPKFHFKVFWDSATISFSEVSGLDTETQIIEYRHGDSPSYYPIKMPGIGKVGNVTMKRGVFVGDTTYWEWYEKIKLNTKSIPYGFALGVVNYGSMYFLLKALRVEVNYTNTSEKVTKIAHILCTVFN